MRNPSLAVAALASTLLLACPPSSGGFDGGQGGGAGGGVGAGGGSDAGAAPDFVFSSEDDVRTALSSVDLPYLMAFSTPDPGGSPETCPVVTTTASGWTGQGGCVNSVGVSYAGDFVVARAAGSAGGMDYTFDFNGWATDAGVWSMEMNGRVTATLNASSCGFPGPSPLNADNLQLVVGGAAIERLGGFFPGAGKSVDLTFRGYRLAWDLNCSPATLTAHGQVSVKGRGSFILDSARQEGGACAHEPLGGSSVFTGANGVTFIYDGATVCDQCAPYVSDAGLQGQLCWQ
jgi:hypothetical protein